VPAGVTSVKMVWRYCLGRSTAIVVAPFSVLAGRHHQYVLWPLMACGNP